MPELVQRPRPAVLSGGSLGEQLSTAAVGQPLISARRRGDGAAAVGQEQRAGLAAPDQAGQQARGLGLPHDHVNGAALAPDLGPPVGEVQVLDVQGEDLRSPRGGLVEQRPQHLFPEAGCLTSEQMLNFGPGKGPGPVRGHPAAPQRQRGIPGTPPLVAPVAERGPHHVDRTVEGGWLPPAHVSSTQARSAAPSIPATSAPGPKRVASRRSVARYCVCVVLVSGRSSPAR